MIDGVKSLFPCSRHLRHGPKRDAFSQHPPSMSDIPCLGEGGRALGLEGTAPRVLQQVAQHARRDLSKLYHGPVVILEDKRFEPLPTDPLRGHDCGSYWPTHLCPSHRRLVRDAVPYSLHLREAQPTAATSGRTPHLASPADDGSDRGPPHVVSLQEQHRRERSAASARSGPSRQAPPRLEELLVAEPCYFRAVAALGRKPGRRDEPCPWASGPAKATQPQRAASNLGNPLSHHALTAPPSPGCSRGEVSTKEQRRSIRLALAELEVPLELVAHHGCRCDHLRFRAR